MPPGASQWPRSGSGHVSRRSSRTWSCAPARRRVVALGRTGIAALALVAVFWSGDLSSQTLESVTIRGKVQTLHLYGTRGKPPVILSSGDGGWISLSPFVADTLARAGFFVIGFDTRAYLAGFTCSSQDVRPSDVPRDYERLVTFATQPGGRPPILAGVSLGAGLSVLAASDPRLQARIDGVIAIGLGDVNELAWRWQDALIYLTHGIPHEPTFRVLDVIQKVSPVPLAIIKSTSDEYVPRQEGDTIYARSRQPKRLWTVSAVNHRFSGGRRALAASLIDATAWIARVRTPASDAGP